MIGSGNGRADTATAATCSRAKRNGKLNSAARCAASLSRSGRGVIGGGFGLDCIQSLTQAAPIARAQRAKAPPSALHCFRGTCAVADPRLSLEKPLIFQTRH
jgi:hypothetical protein